MEARPILILNPRSDAQFVDRAEELSRSQTTPERLQARLRESYPRAVVRARQLSAEPFTVWYVYRDGRWVARDGED